MTGSLSAFLVQVDADADTIQQAARYYLAERTDDLPAEDMRADLLAAASDADQVQELLDVLAVHSDYLEEGALVVLSAAWDEPGQADHVRDAVLAAKAKLPVIEVAILGIVVMYGMYLIATGGKKRERTVVKRSPHGGFTETTETEYFGATGPLSTVANLFGHSGEKP